jgi:hypothetical protein
MQIRGRYFAGLDLGQAHELTALAVVERTVADDRSRTVSYAVRHLERFSAGTPYHAMATRLSELFAKPPLFRCPIVIDLTGVGRPVSDLFKQTRYTGLREQLQIVAGQNSAYEAGIWQVPKLDLVGTLQVLLQTQRLKIAPALAHAQTLVDELTNFKAKPPRADQDPMADWREGAHDDLVLALAIALWQGERLGAKTFTPPRAATAGYRFAR